MCAFEKGRGRVITSASGNAFSAAVLNVLKEEGSLCTSPVCLYGVREHGEFQVFSYALKEEKGFEKASARVISCVCSEELESENLRLQSAFLCFERRWTFFHSDRLKKRKVPLKSPKGRSCLLLDGKIIRNTLFRP